MEKPEIIKYLFYIEHLKGKEIAKILEVTPQNISKTIKCDERYKEEKEFRKKMNAKNRKEYLKEYLKEYAKTYVRKKEETITKEEMEAIHNQDVKELSYHAEISDSAFARWNLSAYNSDKNGNLVLDKKLKCSKDMPKTVYRNAKIKPQRFKKKYIFST